MRPCHEPPQVLVVVLLKTVIAAGVVGNRSLKLIPDTLVVLDAGLGLLIVKVSVVEPPAVIAPPKAFEIVGGV